MSLHDGKRLTGVLMKHKSLITMTKMPNSVKETLLSDIRVMQKVLVQAKLDTQKKNKEDKNV